MSEQCSYELLQLNCEHVPEMIPSLRGLEPSFTFGSLNDKTIKMNVTWRFTESCFSIFTLSEVKNTEDARSAAGTGERHLANFRFLSVILAVRAVFLVFRRCRRLFFFHIFRGKARMLEMGSFDAKLNKLFKNVFESDTLTTVQELSSLKVKFAKCP